VSEHSTILVAVHGPDGPGISAGLMSVLADAGVEIYDVEQIVVRGRLTLNVLIGVSGERATIRDLLFFGWERGLNVEFEKVDDTPTPTRPMSVVTVIGMAVGADDFGSVAGAIADAGGNIDRIFRLSRYPVVSYELLVSNGNLDKMRENLVRTAVERPIDIAIQRDGLERRGKRMVILDVDSTLIQEEVSNLLAREAGAEERCAELTALALNAEIDFEEALRERVALLKGLDQTAITRVHENITLTSGARTFIRTLKRLGMVTAIVSAGFTRFTDVLAADLGIDYSLSNTLEMKDGLLTGQLAGELVDGTRKAAFLRSIAEAEGIPLSQVVAVGDGANDLDMLATAGLGIAFNAKPVVRAQADTAISVPYLDAILFTMGIRRQHVEEADQADGHFDPGKRIEVPGTPPI
jgi:phosphoserine phosphatase